MSEIASKLADEILKASGSSLRHYEKASQERIIAVAQRWLDEAPPNCRPIETAPRDGTKFDVWVPDSFGGHRMTDLSFNARGQLRQHGLLTLADLPKWPTHWMPSSVYHALAQHGEEA